MPLAQQVIGGRSEKLAGIHGFAPSRLAEFVHRFGVGKQTKVPGCAQAGDEINFLPTYLQVYLEKQSIEVTYEQA